MKPIRIIISLLMVLCCTSMAFALAEPQQATPANGSGTHTVQAGDSFNKIARAKGCTAAELAAANNLQLDAILQLGQQLKLPVSDDPQSTPNQTTPTPSSDNTPSHVIKPGETFTTIARHYGISLDSLISANPLAKPTTLRPGQKIILPQDLKPQQAAIPDEENQTASKLQSTQMDDQNLQANSIDSSDQILVTQAPSPQRTARTVATEREMTYGELAAQYGTETERLNSLNGLDLPASAVVVKGADLLVPVCITP